MNYALFITQITIDISSILRPLLIGLVTQDAYSHDKLSLKGEGPKLKLDFSRIK